jgi:hypothetical protein
LVRLLLVFWTIQAYAAGFIDLKPRCVSLDLSKTERPDVSGGYLKVKALIRCLILTACAFPALAQEHLVLKLQAKSVQQTGILAPFNSGLVDVPEPLVQLAPPKSLEREPIPGACSTSGDALCYDYKTGRAVFTPARELMPEISGMRRENLTLKRDKVTFNYSFK